MAEAGKDSVANVPIFSDKPAEEAEHTGEIEKEKNVNLGVAPNAMKPSAVT